MVLCKSKVFFGANIVWITSFLSFALVKKKYYQFTCLLLNYMQLKTRETMESECFYKSALIDD